MICRVGGDERLRRGIGVTSSAGIRVGREGKRIRTLVPIMNSNCIAQIAENARPRILHLVPADGIGGVEVAAKSMAARKDLPCVFRLQFIEPAMSGARSLANMARLVAANVRALRRARRFDPDVVICSLWRSVPLGLALRFLNRRARLVYFLHFGSAVHRYDALLSRLAMARADEVWADSQATLEARDAPLGRSRVISFVTERLNASEKTFAGPSFVSWGRLHHQKGFDRSIRLIADLVQLGVDAQYDIHGPDGGEREALAQLVTELGLGGRVRLLGPIARADLAGVAAEHSFFLQLSRSEGMCMAAVEAMQLGLVPIATAVGEMRRYVVRGETGIIVDPAAPAHASTSVAALVADPESWRRLSNGSISRWRNSILYPDDLSNSAISLLSKQEDK